MFKQIRMIAFDLDNTALDSQKQLRPAVAAAIETAGRKGLIILPATGRTRGSIPPEIMAIPGIRYSVTGNGAAVYDHLEEKVLFEDCFNRSIALEVLHEVQNFQSYISIFLNGVSHVSTREVDFLADTVTPAILEYLRTTGVLSSHLDEDIRTSPHPVEKFSIYYADLVLMADIRKQMERRGDLTITSSMGTNLEFNTKTANKGAALLWLAESLGLRREEVLAVGDSDNDIEMLKQAGIGVAMGNAEDSVVQAADITCPSHDEEGLATLIHQVLNTRNA